MNVFDLVAKLSLDSSEYEEGLSSSGKALEGLKTVAGLTAAGVAAVTGAIAGGTTALIKNAASTAELADGIDKASQKLGISSDAFQEWDFILQHSGTDTEALRDAIKTLNASVASGSESFESLGIAIEEAQNMAPEDLFAQVVENLQNMEQGTDKTALATSLFGEASVKLGALLQTSAADTEAMRQQVHDLGGVLSETAVKDGAAFQDSLQNLQTGLAGVKNSMLADLMPSLTTVMDGITAIVGGDNSGLEQISSGVDDFVTNVANALPDLMDLAGEIIPIILQAIVDNLPKVAQSGIEVITTLLTKIVAMLPDLVATGVSVLVSLLDGLTAALPQLIPAAVSAVTTIVTALLNNLDKIVGAALQLILAITQGLIDSLPVLIAAVPQIIGALVTALANCNLQIVTAAIQLIAQLVVGLVGAIPSLIEAVPQIIAALVKAMVQYATTDFPNIGKQFVDGLWNGIKNNWQSVVNNFKSLGTNLINDVKGIFGIHSPSKVFADIGGNLALGLDSGWEKEIDDVNANIEDSLSFAVPDVAKNVSIDTTGGGMAQVIALLQEYLPQAGNGVVRLDSGAIVGQLAGPMDAALGRLAAQTAKGV